VPSNFKFPVTFCVELCKTQLESLFVVYFIHKLNKGKRNPRSENSGSLDQEYSIVQTQNT